jgi:hypothetical protein
MQSAQNRKCASNSRNKSCCVVCDCTGQEGCPPPPTPGEVALPCSARRKLLQALKEAEQDPTNERKAKIAEDMRVGLTNIWEPICGFVPQSGSSRRRSRRASKKRSRSNRRRS